MPLSLRLALTRCLRSPFFWFWLVECGLLASILQLDVAGGRLVWPVLCFFAGQLTTGLFVDRLASFRPRLVPGYREVYFKAMGATGAALFGLLTVWLAFWSEAPLWPLAGWAALAFAVGCSMMSMFAFFFSVFFLVVAVFGGLVLMQSGRLTSDQVLRYAETGWVNVLLLVVAGFVLARLVHRLWNLDEDQPTFDVILRRGLLMPRWRGAWSMRASSYETKQQPDLISPPLFALRWRDRLLERALRRGPGSFAWNVRRWNLAVDSRRFPQAVMMGSMVGSMVALGPGYSPWAGGYLPGIFLYCVVGVQMGLLFVIFGQYSPGPLFGFESLRPVTRENLIRQRGAGYLRQLAGWLTFLVVVWAVMCAVRAPETPLAPMVAWGSIEIASLATLSALVVCLRTVRSKVVDAVVVIVGSGAAVKGTALIVNQDPWLEYPAVLYAVAAAILLAGAALFWVAYRRWLVVDLE